MAVKTQLSWNLGRQIHSSFGEFPLEIFDHQGCDWLSFYLVNGVFHLVLLKSQMTWGCSIIFLKCCHKLEGVVVFDQNLTIVVRKVIVAIILFAWLYQGALPILFLGLKWFKWGFEGFRYFLWDAAEQSSFLIKFLCLYHLHISKF